MIPTFLIICLAFALMELIAAAMEDRQARRGREAERKQKDEENED